MSEPLTPNTIQQKQEVASFVVPRPMKGLSRGPFSNSHHRSRRAIPPGTIPRGPYAGQPRRPKPNRRRYLSLDQVRNLANALVFADQLGLPLSVAITVDWDLLPGFQPGRWAAHQTALVKVMSEWLRRRGIEPAYVWTREVSGSQWHHTHFQLHILKRNTRRVAGELVAFLSRSFGFLDGGLEESLGDWGMWTPAMRAGSCIYDLKAFDHRDFRYLASGETENIGAALGINHRGTQGEVAIKRAGTSQSLGQAARRAAGWVERRSLEDLRAILRPPRTPKKTKPKTTGLELGRRGLMPVYMPMPAPRPGTQGAGQAGGKGRPGTRQDQRGGVFQTPQREG
jgi:hypothetical protein